MTTGWTNEDPLFPESPAFKHDNVVWFLIVDPVDPNFPSVFSLAGK